MPYINQIHTIWKSTSCINFWASSFVFFVLNSRAARELRIRWGHVEEWRQLGFNLASMDTRYLRDFKTEEKHQ